MNSLRKLKGISVLLAPLALLSLAFNGIQSSASTNREEPLAQGLEVHQIRDYFTIRILKHYVESVLGETSTFIEKTVVDTELPMVWVAPEGGRAKGIIGATSVFGYSHNQGVHITGITTSGAWMVRWGVAGEVRFKPCEITLNIWEYDIPGLEVACGPLVGCVPDKTQQVGKEGGWTIQFPPNSGYGWAELKGEGVIVPGTNSKIEVFLRMHRTPTVKPLMPEYENIQLYEPACNLILPFDPPPMPIIPGV
jgi:hypothetical protein